jgi:hypothetical protein
MTVLTINHSDSNFSQQVLQGIEKMFQTKTSSTFINVTGEHDTSSKTMYAIHPITNTFVEIDPDQVWFWSPEWLAEEMKVDEELRSGEYEEFDNIDDFIDSL